MEIDDKDVDDDEEGNGSQADSRVESGELRDDDRGLQDSSPRKVSSQNSISDRSSNGRHSGDRDGFLLPEFNELIKECNMAVIMDDISPRKNGESLVPDIESPREYKCAEHNEHEREITRLRSEVKILEERKRRLEIQLLEYYGIKDQETAVMELRNQLRLNNMETKLYNLKIESLLSDNRRLEAQVADYANVVTELEAAKAKIKLLRKKLKCEAEQNREQILTLQDRVMKLQDQEKKALEIDQDVEMKLRERKELKEELEEMKKSNQGLKQENSDLAQKLEYVQMLATTALDNEEVLELKEESRRLQQKNDDLKKEIERLQADRCTDIEELVYLRWLWLFLLVGFFIPFSEPKESSPLNQNLHSVLQVMAARLIQEGKVVSSGMMIMLCSIHLSEKFLLRIPSVIALQMVGTVEIEMVFSYQSLMSL